YGSDLMCRTRARRDVLRRRPAVRRRRADEELECQGWNSTLDAWLAALRCLRDSRYRCGPRLGISAARAGVGARVVHAAPEAGSAGASPARARTAAAGATPRGRARRRSGLAA